MNAWEYCDDCTPLLVYCTDDERDCYPYIRDLLKLDVRPCYQHPLPDIACRVTTPLLKEVWSFMLSAHPDKQFVKYIVDGISNGFRIGCVMGSLQPAKRNMLSAVQHPEIIDKYLMEECEKGWVAGLFTAEDVEDIHISRFGVIPKKNQPGRWRLIVDLSHPKGLSVNDQIDPSVCSLTYVSVDEAANRLLQLGQGALMAKVDIQSAYRMVPVHPEDRWMLGTAWRGNIYIDTVLPFGLRSAPKIFNALADSLEWILCSMGVNHSLHYLDDFLFLGNPECNQCETALSTTLATFSKLGVPIAPEKVKGPLTELEFLGIILDSVKGEIRLPNEKLVRLKLLVKQWSSKRACKKRELLSLIGHLSHACKVIRPGRPFLRRLIELSTKAKELHHHLRLNVSIRSDLMWWSYFLENWNGIGLMTALVKQSAEVIVTSDASGSWGCGAFCNREWFSIQWGECWRDLHITIKELLPIVVASILWGRTWTGKHILFRCDNAAVVAIVNSGCSKHPIAMHCTRLVYLLGAVFNFSFQSSHIAGKDNIAADAISRNNHALFLQLTPEAYIQPTPIPTQVREALCQITPNWTCGSWRSLLSSILVRDWQNPRKNHTPQQDDVM